MLDTPKRLFREWSLRTGRLALPLPGRELLRAAARMPAEHVHLPNGAEGHKTPPNPEPVPEVRKPVTVAAPTGNWAGGRAGGRGPRLAA